ncbi:MAG: autotransporter strand-loop-strand O-heptosyltransferase [Schwartzia sp.]|nr:autotransporter strand-loop-strand O-heptosyltransferase [Schwartzia sp. (in: firmicutes)]
MSAFPYKVQYFNAREFDKSGSEMDKMIRYLTYVGAAMAGAIRGETGIPGLKIDFNNGLRLQVPAGHWHVTIGDHDSGMVFYDQDVSETVVVSVEKYYIHWQVEVYRDGAPVFAHVFDPRGQKVRLHFNSNLIGDMLAFLPYVPYAKALYQADVYYTIDDCMEEICHRLLPGFRRQKQAEEDTYATFYFNACLDFPGGAPIDGRMIPMTQTGQIILGGDRPAPKLKWRPAPRSIGEPYVCIGVQASSIGKGWLYPGGWDEVVRYLKGIGYRVLCIDKEKRFPEDDYSIEMPAAAEDFTGNRPLIERADMLHHAAFFIGLSSGLSWLSWTVDCPVVMICGFSLTWYEFPTPYRVYNRLACNGCYNDPRVNWQNGGCPRQTPGSEGMFCCSKSITPRMVIAAIDRLMADRRVGKCRE